LPPPRSLSQTPSSPPSATAPAPSSSKSPTTSSPAPSLTNPFKNSRPISPSLVLPRQTTNSYAPPVSYALAAVRSSSSEAAPFGPAPGAKSNRSPSPSMPQSSQASPAKQSSPPAPRSPRVSPVSSANPGQRPFSPPLTHPRHRLQTGPIDDLLLAL